jgi:hypothetical protein
MALVLGRTLPWGRDASRIAGEPNEATRQGGFLSYGNNGVPGAEFDQIMFESHQIEHILGSANQLSAGHATLTWDGSNFKDKDAVTVTLGDYERILVIGMDTFSANMVIDNVKGLEIRHLPGSPAIAVDPPEFRLGDVGGGEPYKIKLGTNTQDCILDLMTDKPFEELTRTLTFDQKRYIANQGVNNYIKVNGKEIYNPSTSGEIIKVDSLPFNPYLQRMDGHSLHWSADASNVNLAWFRDLNRFLNGLREDGAGNLLETQSRFTISALIASSPWLFQLNTANRFFTDLSALDTRAHLRTSPTAALASTVGTLASGSDVVTFGTSPFIGDIKNGMRIREPVSGTFLPAEASNTIILVDVNKTLDTAKMIDALTGAPVNSSGNSGLLAFTIDNSGLAAGSRDTDYMQQITGQSDIRPAVTAAVAADQIFTDPSGALDFNLSAGVAGTSAPLSAAGGAVTEHLLEFDSANSPSARTHDQTQPKSTGVYYYYKP